MRADKKAEQKKNQYWKRGVEGSVLVAGRGRVQMMLAPTAPPPRFKDHEMNIYDKIRNQKVIGGKGRVQMMLAPTAPLPHEELDEREMFLEAGRVQMMLAPTAPASE